MVAKKPQDLLEFFRRASDEGGPGPIPDAEAAHDLEPTTPMVVFRQSQVIVAGAIALAVVILAFVLGLALGGDGDGGASEGRVAGGDVGVWVIRVISYDNTERGQRLAKECMAQLERMNLGDEVTLRFDRAADKVTVVVGAWMNHPETYPSAVALRERIKTITDNRKAQPFNGAYYWRVKR